MPPLETRLDTTSHDMMGQPPVPFSLHAHAHCGVSHPVHTTILFFTEYQSGPNNNKVCPKRLDMAEAAALSRSIFDNAVITNEKYIVKYVLENEEGGIDVDEDLIHEKHSCDTFPLLVACQKRNEDMAKLF